MMMDTDSKTETVTEAETEVFRETGRDAGIEKETGAVVPTIA